MNKQGNPYGLSSNDNKVDPHMMKNSEWGTVAYLSQNATYGKGREVWINNSSDFITGSVGNSVSASENEGTTNDYKSTQGQEASTTGNVTGVYDMSGGSWEYVAAYVNNSYADDYATSLVSVDEKYKDVYSTGSNDSREDNYSVSTPGNGHYGDAVWETSYSANGSDENSWYGDYSYFPDTDWPLFHRGGGNKAGTRAGVFFFSRQR